jgi:hypothetical protein
MRHTYIRDFKCDTPGCGATQAVVYAYCCSDMLDQECPECGARKTLNRYGMFGIPVPSRISQAAYNKWEEKYGAAARESWEKEFHHTGRTELGFIGRRDARAQFKGIAP